MIAQLSQPTIVLAATAAAAAACGWAAHLASHALVLDLAGLDLGLDEDELL